MNHNVQNPANKGTTGQATISDTDIIKSKALMVRLIRKKLNRNVMDKTIGSEVRDSKKVTESSAVRVNKSLYTKASTDEYMKLYNEGSKYFYRVSLPWDDKGWRLLAVDLYEDFTKKMKSFTKQYRNAVVKFIDNIENAIEESRTMLGDAFCIDDYKFLSPSGHVDRDFLLDQFSFEVEFNTVTSGDDLRASLNDDDKQIIAEQINKQAMDKFARANEHIITNLRDTVYAMHERLCKSENVFRDTLVTNLEDLCDLIPKMNIAGDPAINAMAAEAVKKLGKWDAQTLRDDPKKRKTVADDASKILDNMKGVI
jgi:hypothetical protein